MKIVEIWYTTVMKYVALLRGVNVGGNTMIKMTDLKVSFEKGGFTNIITYINSGNVLFDSEKSDGLQIRTHLEEVLSKTFHYDLRLVVRSYSQLQEVVASIPEEWKQQHDLRCYIAFVREPVSTMDVLKEVELKEEVDSIKIGRQVLYMSTKLGGLTKSGFTKLAGKKIYRDITIRNYTTVQKLFLLMEKN